MKQVHQYPHYQSDVADEEYETGPRRPRTSVKRYQPGDYQGATTTPVAQRSSLRPASRSARTTTVSSAGRQAHTQEFYSGDTEQLSTDWQQVTTQPPSSRRPAAPTRSIDTTVQSIPAQTRPVQSRVSRRQALSLFGGVIAVVSGMGYFKGRSYLQNQVFDQYSEGKQRSTSIAIVCGHNHDSKKHPTQLHAYIEDNSLVVLELPAGDPNKAHITQSKDLRALGYQGDPQQAVISLEAPVNTHGKIPQILIHLEGGPVTVWGYREDRLRLIITDDGTAYRAAPPK